MTGDGRDLTWDAMYTVADRLRAEATPGTRVWAYRQRRLRRVTEGLAVDDGAGLELQEAIRWRRPLSRTWFEIQPVPDAASRIGAFLRARSGT